MKKIMIGNKAIARGAYEAGVTVAVAYPGTPSTEITEFLAEYQEISAEWAPNEKVAFEVALGASIAGARAVVSMKHVGVNVAADPLFTSAYTGVNGGLVLIAADDPAMHSSQNEQDTRYYAIAAGLPLLEPSDSEECRTFIKKAFEISEKYDTPVIFRTLTRVSHSQSIVSEEERAEISLKPYVKNVQKYAMMPAFAKLRHVALEERMKKLRGDVNSWNINKIIPPLAKGEGHVSGGGYGIVTSGAVYQYVREALPEAAVLKLGVINPLPMKLIADFAKSVKRLVVVEELDGIIENQIKAAGIPCEGKNLFSIQGELDVNTIRNNISSATNVALPLSLRGNLVSEPSNPPLAKGGDRVSGGGYVAEKALPSRPPVMCAGCPHRGVFYVLSKLKLTVNADIGCYTLGAQPPLSAVDTVVCMGAGIGMAHGFERATGDSKNNVAVIGDSTFVHSGITGVINAVYNKGKSTIVILDNSTTGMTGHQDNPATGKTLKGEITHQLNLETLVKACGVEFVKTVDAYNMAEVEGAVKEGVNFDGVAVIIAKRPCALILKKFPPACRGEGHAVEGGPYKIDKEKCTKCKMCMKIGCPAISLGEDGAPRIDRLQCTGCGVCRDMCKFGAIVREIS